MMAGKGVGQDAQFRCSLQLEHDSVPREGNWKHNHMMARMDLRRHTKDVEGMQTLQESPGCTLVREDTTREILVQTAHNNHIDDHEAEYPQPGNTLLVGEHDETDEVGYFEEGYHHLD